MRLSMLSVLACGRICVDGDGVGAGVRCACSGTCGSAASRAQEWGDGMGGESAGSGSAVDG